MKSHNATTESTFRVSGGWARSWSMLCLGIGLALTAAGAIGFVTGGEEAVLRFKFAYLAAFMFTLSVGLGALFFVLIQHVTGAKWSIVLRRICEQLMMTLPLSALLFVPILFWMHDLFPWSRPEVMAADATLQAKAAYLNVPFFMIRAGVYFFVWIGLALLLKGKSLRQDRTGDPRIKLSMSRWSAPGILLFALTITFASFDWLMSLSPHWYSTIYGVYYFSGAVIASLAAMVLLAAVVVRSGDVGEAITTEHFHDLGKLLFGFVIFWAYIAFSQLLLIWMANLPEETRWFYDRWEAPGWRAMSYFLVFGHFVFPFFYLLPRTIKRFRPALILGSVWMLAVHYIDMHYLVMPAFSPEHVSLSFREPLLGIGMLLLTISYAFHRMPKSALVPLRDPALGKSMAFQNF
jgi:hypothetical protein